MSEERRAGNKAKNKKYAARDKKAAAKKEATQKKNKANAPKKIRDKYGVVQRGKSGMGKRKSAAGRAAHQSRQMKGKAGSDVMYVYNKQTGSYRKTTKAQVKKMEANGGVGNKKDDKYRIVSERTFNAGNKPGKKNDSKPGEVRAKRVANRQNKKAEVKRAKNQAASKKTRKDTSETKRKKNQAAGARTSAKKAAAAKKAATKRATTRKKNQAAGARAAAKGNKSTAKREATRARNQAAGARKSASKARKAAASHRRDVKRARNKAAANRFRK